MSIPNDQVHRVLVTRLRFLGDVVLSTPVLGALRRALPQARIEYLTFDRYAPVLDHHPWVDQVHAMPSRASALQAWRLWRDLRRPRIDWWIDLYGNPRSSLWTTLARPRVAVGPDRGFRRRAYHHRLAAPSEPSAVAHHLHMLEPLLGPQAPMPVRIAVTEAERREAAARFNLTGGEGPVLLHPGSTWPSKAWPPAKWAELARRLVAMGLGPVVFLSPPTEVGLAQRLAEVSGTIVLPPLELRSLLSVVSGGRAYVGNDGGILHCAVGLGVPTVGIFGPTERDIWFPHESWGPYRVLQEYVPCRPCHLHRCSHLSCLVDLPVARVQAAVAELVGAQRGEALA